MRYGIVGTGNAFRAHAATISLFKDASISAVCGRDPDRLEAARTRVGRDCRAYRDFREFVHDPAVDFVVVATSNAMHAAITTAALDAGKHVLCEKPLGITPAEAAGLVALAQTAAGSLFVGLEFRCSDLFRKIADLLGSGAIGVPRFLTVRQVRGYLQGGSDGWRLSGGSGGMLLELCIHQLDILNWLSAGRALRVAGLGGNVFHKEHQPDDQAMIFIEYDNEAKASMNVCLHGPWSSFVQSQHCLTVVGEDAMLEAFPDLRTICITRGLDEREIIELGEQPFLREYERLPHYRRDYDSWSCHLYPQHVEIRKALAGEPSAAAGPDIGYESVLVSCAAQEAVRRRCAVDVEALRG